LLTVYAKHAYASATERFAYRRSQIIYANIILFLRDMLRFGYRNFTLADAGHNNAVNSAITFHSLPPDAIENELRYAHAQRFWRCMVIF